MARILALLAVAAMALGACANNSTPSPAAGGTTSTTTSSPTTSPSSVGATTLSESDSSLGTILVDVDGFTLYMFEQDTGTTGTCTGSCASTWPMYKPAGKLTAGDGVDASVMATNDQGQLTYAGHPLYRYAPDQQPGDTGGEGVSGVWFAVSPDGTKVESSSSSGYHY